MRLVGNKVLGHRGDVLAEKIRNTWHTKDPKVLEFIAQEEAPKKKPAKKKVQAEEKLEMVRARDENGHFVSDDPTTEVNEAWVVKTVKKVTKK
jgi:hypothetical protein